MTDDHSHDDRFTNVAGYALLLAISLAMFWPVLTGVAEFGYRDSATLYSPLFQWTSDRVLNGDVPLWCAQDNWGAPVVADVTSSVFYPGKVIFLCRFLPFSVLFGVFTLIHVWLAALAARWCARRLGASLAGAWLTGISYGFGGSVLFQTCNIVFLVSAAWLPIAMGLIYGWATERHRNSLILLAVALSMMILGGDPQMAFHCMLIAAITWLVRSGEIEYRQPFLRRIASSLLPLLAVGIIAFLLTAVQVLPAIQWSERSERSMLANDRSIYRAWTHGDVFEEDEDRVNRFASPRPGTHQDAIYQFSQTPWSLVDLVWPNILGKQEPWSSGMAGADRAWNGGIYLGVLTLLLAMVAVGSHPLRGEHRSLLVVLTLFLLGSFGWYGIGWVVNELNLMRGGTGSAHLTGEPTGGVYWLMEMLVPGYYRFRYPAKLFVIAAMVICLLGGKGLDCISRSPVDDPEAERTKRVFKLTLSLVGITLFFAALTFLNRMLDYQLFSIVDDSATRVILQALLHTGIVLSVFGGLWCWRGRNEVVHRYFRSMVIAVAAIELAIATSWTVQLVPIQEPVAYHGSEIFDETVARDKQIDGPHFQLETREMLSEQLRRDRQSLYPKFHLLAGKRLVGSFNSVQPLDISAMLPRAFDRQYAEFLSIDGIARSDLSNEAEVQFQRWGARPRVHFALGTKPLPPVNERSRQQVVQRTNQFFEIIRRSIRDAEAIGKRRRFMDVVVVEGRPKLLEILNPKPEQRLTKSASVECIEHHHQRQRFAVKTDESRLLVIADYFDTDWKAIRVENGLQEELPTVRVNRVLTGIVVPPGEYEIEYVYRPIWFYAGAWISCLAWALPGAWWIRDRRRR